MAKIVDRLLLFIYSLSILILSILAILLLSRSIRMPVDFRLDLNMLTALIAAASVLILISLRLLYVSLRTSRSHLHLVDQRTDLGDIQISVETIENLCLKAASRVRGVKDPRTRIRMTEPGLEVQIRAVIDGEHAIPQLTEEVQRGVKSFVQEITGVPVASVSVYISGVAQAPAFKSRVE
ncbi:alkaline shock response membrane anchor protein AmaP [Saccharibacillus sp. CPCC 101409]|uniref:alkaline shock response membrane anchor protein AmaP n=1 Tax=Saccharibacillus sp. CPCC 101409 TaxID=3058041 RepID=UPI0026718132|nr:alkaline shock response membrane anchor protein AmaP [Saccharibacillus sp. CPCC 101409]MDO3409533.1 alkaline shock response membrane anchor protein AmaP [Saccharibacillus sp. CPCC 101409]